MPPAPYAILRDVSKPRSRHSTTVESDDLPGHRKPGASSSEPSSERPEQRSSILPPSGGVRLPSSTAAALLVLTLVEQLSALLRGTTTATQSGAVRRAASRALDLLDRVDEGEADLAEADQALREVEAMLVHRRP